jgi:hypothetical protein
MEGNGRKETHISSFVRFQVLTAAIMIFRALLITVSSLPSLFSGPHAGLCQQGSAA